MNITELNELCDLGGCAEGIRRTMQGVCHRDEAESVLDHGDDIGESRVRMLFPEFEGVPYAR